MELRRYQDIMANVRHDNEYHSITSLVQPDDPEVKKIAQVLMQADDFVKAAQEFVNSFTTYRKEVGDYWTTPVEILAEQAGDCDDKAILLTSILRNGLPADKVFCAFGHWSKNGAKEGHMWVALEGTEEADKIIEATAGPNAPLRGHYTTEALFNDRYAFSYPSGIKNFNLLPVVAGKEPA